LGAKAAAGGLTCVLVKSLRKKSRGATTEGGASPQACRDCHARLRASGAACGRCRLAFCESCADTFRADGDSLVRMCNTCLHFTASCGCRAGEAAAAGCEHWSADNASDAVCECQECLKRLVRARGPNAVGGWLDKECVSALRTLERDTRVRLSLEGAQ
jgi:hypothetical protein